MSIRNSGDHRNRDIVEEIPEENLWQSFSDDLSTWSTVYEPAREELDHLGRDIDRLKKEQLKAQNAQTKVHQKSYSSRGGFTGGSRYSGGGNRNYNTRAARLEEDGRIYTQKTIDLLYRRERAFCRI